MTKISSKDKEDNEKLLNDIDQHRVFIRPKIKQLCSGLLQTSNDLRLPPVKPRIAYFTVAGPSGAVSNFEIKIRGIEFGRMQNSDYRIRVHQTRCDSSQGEAERTNSAIADSIVAGAIIDWESIKKYEGMTSNEIENMSVSEFEAHKS